jgi:hypothetical protein
MSCWRCGAPVELLCLSMEILNPSKAEVAIYEFFIGGSFDPLADRSPHTVRVSTQWLLSPIFLQLPSFHHAGTGHCGQNRTPPPFKPSQPVPPPQCFGSVPRPARPPAKARQLPSLCRWNNLPRAASLPSAIAGNFFHAYRQLLLLIPGSTLAGKMHLNF